MTRSSHTLQLWSAAHKSGDDYYRHVSDSLHDRDKLGEKSAELAASYLESLRKLEHHLETVDGSDGNEDLKVSTRKFIDLVLGDLKRFEETNRYELSNGKSAT